LKKRETILKNVIEFPNPKIVREEVFRYGDLDITVGMRESAYRDFRKAAEVSGDPVSVVVARYAFRLFDVYFKDRGIPRRRYR